MNKDKSILTFITYISLRGYNTLSLNWNQKSSKYFWKDWNWKPEGPRQKLAKNDTWSKIKRHEGKFLYKSRHFTISSPCQFRKLVNSGWPTILLHSRLYIIWGYFQMSPFCTPLSRAEEISEKAFEKISIFCGVSQSTQYKTKIFQIKQENQIF